ncbi:MAG: LuxR C-terminal-related transcriptional regulator [Chitinophagaceae bacterium]
MKVYRVGIADDHLLFAEGISNIIQQQPALELVFITGDGKNLVELITEHAIQILLLDIKIPPLNGLELLPKLKAHFPRLKVMIISMYQPTDIQLDLKQFIGDAYVLKISGREILEDALQALVNNQQYFDPNIVYKKRHTEHIAAELKLTKREKEIIALIAAGKTSKEIAAQLYLSELTVKTHRKNISEKLGTKSIADLVTKTMHFNNP